MEKGERPAQKKTLNFFPRDFLLCLRDFSGFLGFFRKMRCGFEMAFLIFKEKEVFHHVVR